MIYVTKKGDTYKDLARLFYGDDKKASYIKYANPELGDDIPEGAGITIPNLNFLFVPENYKDSTDVYLKVDNGTITTWQSITVTMNVSSFDSLVFEIPMTDEAKSIFKPFTFNSVQVYVGSALIFNGTVISVAPSLTQSGRTLSVACYPVCGVLNDCMLPVNAFPLEFVNKSITDIVTEVCDYFGIKVKNLSGNGAYFDLVSLKPDQKVLDFLIELANQRSLILTNDENGDLILYKLNPSSEPVANLSEGYAPLESVSCSFNHQNYYSHISGIEPPDLGFQGSVYTLKNKRLKGVLRPYTYELKNSGKGQNNKLDVNAKMGRMFANSLEYNVTVSSWRDASGNIWRKGSLITLLAPSVFVDSVFDFVIRDVSLSKTTDYKESAALTLVLKEAYNGKVPDKLPF